MLPTQTQEIFRSNSEPSLAPGDRIIFVLSFTNIAYKSLNTITITADPSNAVSESSETNNVATYQILTNVQYQNSNQYYYQTGQYYPYNNSNYYYDGQYQYPYYTNGYSTGGNYYPNYSYPSYSNSLYY